MHYLIASRAEVVFNLFAFLAFVFPQLALGLNLYLLSTVRGGGRAGQTQPRNGNRKQRRANGRQRTIIAGSQELSLVVTPTPSGSTLTGKHDLIPTFEQGSRLSRAAVQFSQYNILSSVVIYEPHCTTTTSGRIALAWTFDPLESAPVSVRQIIQMAGGKMTRLYSRNVARMPSGSPDKRRFPIIEQQQYVALDTVDRKMFLPATIVFGLDGSAQSGLTAGSLIWHYKIEFFNPNLTIGATLQPITLDPELQVHAPPTITYAHADVDSQHDDEPLSP